MKAWQQVDFSNRFMFRLVMDDAELCRRVLEVLLGIKILKLAEAVDRERSDSGKAVLYMTWQQTLMEEKCKGRAEGKIEGKVENLYSLVKQGLLTLGVAAAQMQMTEQEFLQAGKKLGLSL